MACVIPRAMVTMLRNPALAAADFVPTKFILAASKAWFATYSLRFASTDSPKRGE